MRAAQERHAIKDVLLEPCQPEIDHRRDAERKQLRNDQPPKQRDESRDAETRRQNGEHVLSPNESSIEKCQSRQRHKKQDTTRARSAAARWKAKAQVCFPPRLLSKSGARERRDYEVAPAGSGCFVGAEGLPGSAS